MEGDLVGGAGVGVDAEAGVAGGDGGGVVVVVVGGCCWGRNRGRRGGAGDGLFVGRRREVLGGLGMWFAHFDLLLTLKLTERLVRIFEDNTEEIYLRIRLPGLCQVSEWPPNLYESLY